MIASFPTPKLDSRSHQAFVEQQSHQPISDVIGGLQCSSTLRRRHPILHHPIYDAIGSLLARAAGCLSLVVLILGQTATVQADPVVSRSEHGKVELTVTLSSDAAQVAEPLTVNLQVVAPEGVSVAFPEYGSQLGTFDVTHVRSTPDIPDGVRRIWQQQLTIETIKTGQLEVPAIDIAIFGLSVNEGASGTADSSAAKSQETTQRMISTKPLRVQIASVLEDRADPTKFHDIQTVIDVPIPVENSNVWIVWIGVGMGGLVLTSLAALAILRRRSYLSPAAWALVEIEELKKSTAMEFADSGAVMESLAGIVRQYLALSFEGFAGYQTSDELLASARTLLQIGEAENEQLSQLFSLADNSKFAGLALSPSELSEALQQASDFIHACVRSRQASGSLT